MKNVLLVGANSDSAKSLIEQYSDKYNFLKLSRDASERKWISLISMILILIIQVDIRCLVYFPGTANLIHLKALKLMIL